MPDVSGVKSFDEMKAKHIEVYPDKSPNSNTNNAAQLWAFLSRIQKNDLIVLPLKTMSAVAIGKVIGDYKYSNGRHTRKVEWLKDDLPRNTFGQDLLYSFGAFMTVCQIRRNEAEERVKAILSGKADPHFSGISVSKGKSEEEISDDEKGIVDLEEQAYDHIRMVIGSKFRGHDLTRLVEAILNVNGYQTYRAPAGPDGGADILAGYGPMGFDKPRICVQVKSGEPQKDTAIRELEGVMSRVGAEQGLFVSWDGFNKTVLGKMNDLFFRVRLWDGKKLITELLSAYDKLPDEIQADLPMKRIWVIVPEEN